MSVRIQIGSLADYRALARFHYRAGPPATVRLVLVARERDRSPIGVLVASNPTLNGPWRELAWPGLFPARRPALLNAEVRTISRVIVEPRFRGRGIAAELVRAYLREPLTRRTEAIAAMSAFCSLFARAGMRPILYPPARRVRTLLLALRELNIPARSLADPDALIARTRRPIRAELGRVLRSFARAHRDTRPLADADLRTLAILAARRASARPIAFVHDADSEPTLTDGERCGRSTRADPAPST
ncbi:MAG: hypothetical protein IT438_10255 [Phycisphaerales bacterium]|nr:hypothetical protein [Phycisphaerales bacterium]